jgi:hypothetical protein
MRLKIKARAFAGHDLVERLGTDRLSSFAEQVEQMASRFLLTLSF